MIGLKYTITLLIFGIFSDLVAQISDSISLNTIEVTNSRIVQKLKEHPRSVSIITANELQNLPVQSIAEALQMVAGVDIRRRGPNNIQSDVSIRGGSFDQVLILVNGVKMNDAQTGHHTLNIPLELLDIDHIEVIRGPAAKTYGQNAFSGAINFVTKPKGEPTIKALVGKGNFNTLQLATALTGGGLNGKLAQQLSYNAETSDGYDYNRDYSLSNLFYDGSLKATDNATIRLFGGYSSRKFGANGFYALPTHKDQYEEVQTSIAALQSTITSGNVVFTPSISWRRNFDYYEFIRNKPEIFTNRTMGNRVTGNVNASWANALGTLGIGIELNREYLRSLRLGDHDRNIFGFHIEQKFNLLDNKLLLTPGVFINKFSDRPAQLLPGADAAYLITDITKIIASINKANRIPTYTDLFYTSSAEVGNKDLVNESVLGYELGIATLTRKYELGVSTYINNTSNLIDWTKNAATDAQWVARNYIATTISGLEINAATNVDQLTGLTPKIKLFARGSFIKAKSANNESIYVTRYQFNNIGTQLIGGATVGLFNNMVLGSINYRKIDRVGEDLDPVTKNNLLDANLFDISLSTRYKLVSLQYILNNATDQKYKEISNVLMPGRWHQVQLRYAM